MNIQTVQMDPRIAAIHYRDYRRKVRDHKHLRQRELERRAQAAGKELGRVRIEKTQLEKEDTILMESYRALARGQRVINLLSVMRDAKFDAKKKLPVLAIARADWEKCWLKQENGHIVFSGRQWPSYSWSTGTYKDGSVFFPISSSAFAAEVTNADWRKNNNLPVINNQRALVPAIPAHLRPSGDLSKYHILWEAEWELHAPVDPLLLRHVSGYVYTVLAQWDLTSIEQMVLEGRVG